MKSACLILCFCTLLCSALAQTAAPKEPSSATVPVTLDHNRIIIDVRFPLPDGSAKRVRAWVDNGNPEMWMTDDLAKNLGLAVSAEGQKGNGVEVRTSPPPSTMIIGGVAIHPSDVKQTKVIVGRDAIAPGMSAEINIPSTVLRHYEVAIDYLNREFTIAAPGTLHPKGASGKVTVNAENGLIQVPTKLAEGKYNLALDVGSSYSLVSETLVAQLGRAYPKWPRMTGAVGAANFWGTDDEAYRELLRIPMIEYGPVTLQDVGVASLPEESIEFFQKRAGMATAGLLGGNAFLNYRISIDYAHSTVYFEQTSKRRPPQMDVVGLVLRPEPDGRYTVVGVAEYQGKPAVSEVKPGDELAGIDQTKPKFGTMGQVWSLLSGSPGEVRTLMFRRGGESFTVKAVVRRFLE